MLRNLLSRFGRWLDRERETGDSYLVENTGRYRSANPEYYAVRVRVVGENGEETICLLFTTNEWKQATDRAQRNPEDVPWCDSENCGCFRPQ